jgi:hypothetical protein
LQISLTGTPGETLHTVPLPFALQTRLPVLAHWPMPTLQLVLMGKPSSIAVSQSSSKPLHSSAVGVPGVALQTEAKPSAEQTRLPGRAHWPMPDEQGPPTLKPSSMSVSQSLSTPSQRSAPQGAFVDRTA